MPSSSPDPSLELYRVKILIFAPLSERDKTMQAEGVSAILPRSLWPPSSDATGEPQVASPRSPRINVSNFNPMLRNTLLLTVLPIAWSTAAEAQRLFVPESTNDMIMEFSPINGALLNPAAIDLGAITNGDSSVPMELIDGPNGEIWVTDQLADSIFRLSGNGQMLIGTASNGLDDVRGIAETATGAVVTNNGQSGSAPGPAVIALDSTATSTNSYTIGRVYDLEPFTFGGVDGFLASEFNNDDLVFVPAANPGNQSLFHESDGSNGISFPEQICVAPSGRVFAAGFFAPSGIFEYDPATGNQIDFINLTDLGFTGVRGVHLLADGNFLFTTATGVHRYSVSAGTVTTLVSGVSARFISLLDGTAGDLGVAYCTANPNSTGFAASISASGSAVVSNNSLTLRASTLPQLVFGLFLVSRDQDFVTNPGGSAGNLCLGGMIGRYVGPGQVQNSGVAGTISLALDLSQIPQPNGFVSAAAGETWNFQAWYRDGNSAGVTSNFTTGLEITFQ